MLKYKYFFLPILLWTFATFKVSFGQDVKEWFVEAESYFLFEEYNEALPVYHRILRAEPQNYNVQCRIGVCYLNDIYQYPKSIRYLEAAAQHINFDYKDNSYREKMAPPEAQYFLGRAYHINNRFDEAIESYQRFMNFASADEYDLDLVQADIDACQRAKKIFTEPVFFSPENLGSVINSRREDINPVISGDGKVLILTRKLPFYTGVFISYKNDKNEWSDPVDLTPDFALDGDSYGTGISYHGDEIFVYRSDNYDGNIYSSKRVNNKWTKLAKLNDKINTKYWESHASPSPDGQYLIFTSNRAGGYGGLDIYRSQRGANGQWEEPVNLGPVINSPSNEDTPFLSNNGNTLFFSSQGHTTVGGYDIFISTLNPNGTWTEPLNLGYPVNTTNDDLFYCPIGIDAFGLYAFYNEETSNGMLDVYEVEIYNKRIPRNFKITGNIRTQDLQNTAAKDLRIKLLTASGSSLVGETVPDAEGSFELSATQGDYLLIVEGEGIETYQKKINLELTRKNSDVVFNDIAIKETSLPYVPVTAVEVKDRPVISAGSTSYSVTGSDVIPIELNIPQGSQLDILVYLDGELIADENLEDVNKRFTYFYGPQPGENTINFKATDPDGNVSTVSVDVHFEAPLVADAGAVDGNYENMENRLAGNFLQQIAVESLGDFLDEIDPGELTDYYNLYSLLINASETGDFSSDDVQSMFAILFTQRKMEPFVKDLSRFAELEEDIRSGLLDSADIPYEYLVLMEQSGYLTDNVLRSALLNLIRKGITSDESLLFLISTFSTDKDQLAEMQELNLTHNAVWERLANRYGEQEALDMIYLAATTEELNYFYQNMLADPGNRVHKVLVGLDLEANDIHNSIDLVRYLFSVISENTYTERELLMALEEARLSQPDNLRRFQALLESRAEGALKLQIGEALNYIDINSSYGDLLNYLIRQSGQRDYTSGSVYDLLIQLIGITDVNEFAEKLISYHDKNINRALLDTSIESFSSPLELVLYLIAEGRNYNFTNSDINNMLIRMILEEGMMADLGDDTEGIPKEEEAKLWKNKRFISTIILVNIALIILIILFAIRRRKSKK